MEGGRAFEPPSHGSRARDRLPATVVRLQRAKGCHRGNPRSCGRRWGSHVCQDVSGDMEGADDLRHVCCMLDVSVDDVQGYFVCVGLPVLFYPACVPGVGWSWILPHCDAGCPRLAVAAAQAIQAGDLPSVRSCECVGLHFHEVALAASSLPGWPGQDEAPAATGWSLWFRAQPLSGVLSGHCGDRVAAPAARDEDVQSLSSAASAQMAQPCQDRVPILSLSLSLV